MSEIAEEDRMTVPVRHDVSAVITSLVRDGVVVACEPTRVPGGRYLMVDISEAGCTLIPESYDGDPIPIRVVS